MHFSVQVIIKRSVEGNQAMKDYNAYKASQQHGKP